MPAKRKPTPAVAVAVAAAAAVAALVAFVVVYEGGGAPGKAEIACAAPSKALAARLGPLAHGEIAALNVAKNPTQAPALSFDAPDGRKLTLADFKGKALVLNLWATWCVPCRAEMPALDKLQAAQGGPDFEVVAVNIDTARRERAPAFLDEIGVKTLARYADPSADSFETLRLAGSALGLPTSLLIDKDGCELGVVAGGANWVSPEAIAAVKTLAGG